MCVRVCACVRACVRVCACQVSIKMTLFALFSCCLYLFPPSVLSRIAYITFFERKCNKKIFSFFLFVSLHPHASTHLGVQTTHTSTFPDTYIHVHTYTLSHTHIYTHTQTHITHSHRHSLSLTHTRCLKHTHSHTYSHSLFLSHIRSLSHAHSHTCSHVCYKNITNHRLEDGKDLQARPLMSCSVLH